MPKRKKTPKSVESLKHKDAFRINIPTAEYEPVLNEEQKSPIQKAYERRNRDLDPQLVWRGKDEQDWSDLVVQAPPLYIQEKIHPKVLIDDLQKRSGQWRVMSGKSATGHSPLSTQIDLFADFNGAPEGDAKTEFYQHDTNWTNRMILGDALQVMASLAEREGLRGQVQCIYLDPPYGIKFNSNFQWSTTSRNVTDGKVEHITREPEQVKAFRDTWRDGIHSYLTYLRDRLTVARDLLADSGCLFMQIGDENSHRVRALLDEVFGEDNFISEIVCLKTSGQASKYLGGVCDYVILYAKDADKFKYRQIYNYKVLGEKGTTQYIWSREKNKFKDKRIKQDDPSINPENIFAADNLNGQGAPKEPTPFKFQGKTYNPSPSSHWKPNFPDGMIRLEKSDRLKPIGNSLMYRRYLHDFKVSPINNVWDDVLATGLTEQKYYVVQTSQKIIERCILLSTDPGDLVLDPTCGSGTTAFVSEQWGRRWITIDTSRVALALARTRIMGAKYPYYLLSDSKEGKIKEAEITRTQPSTKPSFGDIRQGFVYDRAPHITLGKIANNSEIDVIWDDFQEKLEPLRKELNEVLNKNWKEWEIPREAGEDWPDNAKQMHADWWKYRIARQEEIDASIAANSEQEYLYDQPYEDKSKVRVAGPFTVESLSPHRTLAVDENDEFVDGKVNEDGRGYTRDFTQLILENLKMAGVQQAHKEDKISFTSLTPWPGEYICAEGIFQDEKNGEKEKRAGIFIGPEFGTVARPDLVAAAREAADAGFDVLIACAFNFEAHATEFDKLGRIPVLKARMNADLHMADDLTGKGNLFVIFGEPDIDILKTDDDKLQVKVNGVDVFHPQTGEIRSDGSDGIACWFIDTDYNEESFFVRHAYFLGAGDPYKSLKRSLKSEINKEAWETLYSDTSRPFDKPESGRIAVKVINHLGDEVMKVYRVG